MGVLFALQLFLLALLSPPKVLAVQITELIPFGASWQWLHPTNGVDPAVATPNFHSTWMMPGSANFPNSGNAILAYGAIGGWANQTNIGTPISGQRYTAYFKRTFALTRSVSELALQIIADDGAVIYIDGERVASFNYSGADTYFGLANDESIEGQPNPIRIQKNLSAGTHTIAVSIHNAHTASTDLGMNLRLLDVIDPVASGTWTGNGHTYEVRWVSEGVTWSECNSLAQGLGGHLATITSADENNFVFSIIQQGSSFFWRYFTPTTLGGPYFGGVQADGSAEPDSGWGWITGESNTFSSWESGFPGSSILSKYTQFRALSTPAANWGDTSGLSGRQVAYIVEYPVSPIVTSVSPNPVPGINGQQAFYINGSIFEADCSVTLRDLTYGNTYANRPIILQTATQIQLSPNFSADPATWTVEVINPGGASSGQYQFTVGGTTAPFIARVSPNPVTGINGQQDFVLSGINFASNCSVTLRDLTYGGVYTNRTKYAVLPTSITLKPNFTATAATWSVEVISSGGASSGQYQFPVNAPAVVPTVTPGGAPSTQTGTQTLTLLGNFTAGSIVRFFSLDTGVAMSTPATINPDGSATVTQTFADTGKWAATVQAADGQTSQPIPVSVVSSALELSFPLRDSGLTAYTHPVSSIFDHAMTDKYTPGTGATLGVRAFNGEYATEKFQPVLPGSPLYSFRKPDHSVLLSGVINYNGGSAAYYDGHNGYDYPAGTGTAVYAAAPGKVIETKTGWQSLTDGLNGNFVRIQHGTTGYQTAYIHLNSVESGISNGLDVYEGQLIGTVGNTGNSGGAHLHFTVNKLVGKTYVSVDPYGWIGSGVDSYKPANTLLWRAQELPRPHLDVSEFQVSAAGTSGAQSTIIHAGLQNYSAAVRNGDEWISITNGASGSGNSTLSFTVAANAGAARIGEIAIQIPVGGTLKVVVKQAGSGNPTSAEIVAQMKLMAKKFQIPTVLIAAIAHKESQWRQFDTGGAPLVGVSGDIGLMQINTGSPAVSMDIARVGSDWIYNLEIGCRILKEAKWGAKTRKALGPWASEKDLDPAILENWFYPVAWYNGQGTAAYAYISAIWGYLKSPPSPISDYFSAIPDIGDPRDLFGFPTTINTRFDLPNIASAEPGPFVASGLYTLSLLKLNDAAVHYWNWDNNSASAPAPLAAFGGGIAAAASGPSVEAPIDVTEAISTAPIPVTYNEWADVLGYEEDSSPIADADSDGLTNLIEFVTGGDPLEPSAASVLAISRNAGQIDASVTISKSAAGVSVGIQTSSDLTGWATTATVPVVIWENQTAKTLRWSFPDTGGAIFVRLLVTKDSE